MTREEEAARLAAIRTRHAAASTDQQRGMTEAGEGILGRLIPKGELQPIFLFDPWTDRSDIEFGIHAHADIAFLLSLLDRAMKYIRRQRADEKAEEERARPFDFARDCAIYCGKQAFWTFLHKVHGLDHPDKLSVETKVRFLLNIQSRTELNTNPEAAQRWISLRGDFEAWRRI